MVFESPKGSATHHKGRSPYHKMKNSADSSFSRASEGSNERGDDLKQQIMAKIKQLGSPMAYDHPLNIVLHS